MTAAAGLSEDARPRLAPGVLLRHDRARGQWVLLGPERVLVLDEVALEVVRACVGGADPVGQGIDRLVQAFDAPRPTIAADVLALLADLRLRGFVVL